MSFSITLQRNASEVNKVDKSLTTITTMTGTLKNETSIIDPVIIFEASLSDLKNCNYCTISNFGRSYFVNNIRSVRNGLVELSCHVDVLSTYKSQIRNQFALVKRQQENWNLYLKMRYSVEQFPRTSSPQLKRDSASVPQRACLQVTRW